LTNLDTALIIAIKTGKVLFGANMVLKNVMNGKTQLVIAASNCPKKLRTELEYYCKLSKIPFLAYPKTSAELGRLCNKAFSISTLAIRDLGDSDIIKKLEENNV